MTTFRDRLNQIQAEITEITAEHLEERIAAGDAPIIIDVRQRDEIADGRLDHAHAVPFGLLELELPRLVPDRDAEVVLYCAGGTRSALAAHNAQKLGYTRLLSMAGGFGKWKQIGGPFKMHPLPDFPEDPEADAPPGPGVPTLSPLDLQALLASDQPPILLDVREDEETLRGSLKDAQNVVRGRLAMRIESVTEDRDARLVVLSSRGVRAAWATVELHALGYRNAVALQGGVQAWQEAGLPIVRSNALSPQARMRYSRHLLIPEVGEAGQLKLLGSKVLLMGAGGLGSPSAYYLAAAGVGTLGIIDSDVVDRSNLQRQILHADNRVGMPKVESARATLQGLNPDIQIKAFNTRLTSENVDAIFGEGWDVILDGGDNFPTRYLVNDACVKHNIPCVHGSVYRFEGQVTVFKPHQGPCYRCLYPEPPPPDMAPSCAEAGVLGVLPGIIGLLQAVEAIKVLLGVGNDLAGRLVHFDALQMKFRELRLRRDPECPVCGEHPTWTGYIDYEHFCGLG